MGHIIYLSVFIFELSLLAMATDLLAGHAGKIGVSAIFFGAIGGYGYALLTTRLLLHPILAIISVCIFVLILSYLCGFFLLNLKANEYLLGTFALEVGFISAVRNSDLTGGPLGIRNIPSPVDYIEMDDPTLAASIILGFSLIVSIAMLHRTLARDSPFGLRLRSARDDSRSANALGINVKVAYLIAFIIQAITSCIAGIGATVAQAYINPDSFGIELCLWVLAVVYLGGTGGKPAWMLISAFLYVALNELLALSVHDPLWVGPLQQITFNVGLILILLLRRRGLAGPALEEGPTGHLED
jgi:branched-chain amino acid transport system permease protein